MAGMTRAEVERAVAVAETRLDADPEAGLAGTGFWSAVAQVKRDPELTSAFADRIAAVDREAFRRWAFFTVPLRTGTFLAAEAALAGLAAAALAYYVDDPWNGVLLLAGTGTLLVSTHGLAHLIAGRAAGIRFTHWFIGTLGRPQPGVKTDYASYLAASPRGRAWMHASGALVTKIIPFALIPAAVAARVPGWTIWVLAAIGAAGVITDVLWSVRISDWKKFRREMSYVRR